MMLLYFKDEDDLMALRIAMGYYFHNEIAENTEKFSAQELLIIASRFIRIIEQLDEEIKYYDTSEQKD